jgi:hypothetical protein
METELINPVVSNLAKSDRVQRLVTDFLAGRKATTLRTYAQGLADFAQFMLGASADSRDTEGAATTGASAVNEAARRLLSLDHGEANHAILNYRADMPCNESVKSRRHR